MTANGFNLADLFKRIRRQPLSRMLLLSCALHVAVVMIVQPRVFPNIDQEVVISARLMDPEAEAAVEEALPLPETTVPEKIAVPESVKPPLPEPAPPTSESTPVPVQKSEAASTAPALVTTDSQPQPESAPRPSQALPSVPVMVDPTWYEARQLDVQPKAAAAITPRYPPDAQRQGIEGSVKLRLRIDEFGAVHEVEVEEGDPPGVFDESALEAFRKGRFIAARKDSRPVRAQILIRVRYELDD